MSKAQAFYWLSMTVLAIAPLAMFLSAPRGFFDGPHGD